MNVHRWCVSSSAILFFFLLAVPATHGLVGMWMKIVPENPAAHEPIKFTVYTGAPGVKFIFTIYPELPSISCTNFIRTLAAAYNTTKTGDAATGIFVVTLSQGLPGVPVNQYAVVVVAATSTGNPNGCWDLQVGS